MSISKMGRRSEANRPPLLTIAFRRAVSMKFYDLRMKQLAIIGLILLAVSSHLPALDPSIARLAVSVGSRWDATSGKLQLFERDGREWRAAWAPFRVLYGKSGLASGTRRARRERTRSAEDRTRQACTGGSFQDRQDLHL